MTSAVMSGVVMSCCRSCGLVHFPRRLACPSCHSDDLIAAVARRGVVEQTTLSGQHILASVRSDLGPTVIASFAPGADAVRCGDVVELSAWPYPAARGPVGYVPGQADNQSAGTTRVLPEERTEPTLLERQADTDCGKTSLRADEVTTRAPFVSPLRGLPISECTLPALLNRQADAYGSKTLVEIDGSAFSYIAVRDLAAATADLLQRNGIRAGDRVATLFGNRLELLQLILGCAWAGAIAVPLNAELRGDQLEHALVNSGARILVVDSSSATRPRDLRRRPAALERIWYLDDADPELIDGNNVEAMPTASGFAPAADVGPGDTAVLLYTSGTTGVSKGVCCPHAQFYWWGVNVTEQLGITETDILYTCLPMFHTNALNAFVQALVSGASIVVGRRFSASRFWHDLAASGATVTYLLGAMVNILWSRDPGPYDRAHSVRIALSPATPAALFEPFLQRFGFPLYDGFGSTETNSVLSPAPQPPRAGYLGRVQPGFEAMVVDEHDAEVPDGTPGELILRSRAPFAFATGYLGMPDKTVAAWRNLWFHTGDRVVREPDGWYRFIDRIKDVIRRRGENISSFEIEQVIGSHPAVEVVAAYPVPSEMAEDEVMVAVVPRPGCDLRPEDVVRHCAGKLAGFAVPRFVDIVTELPTTENGKVRKVVLRQRGRTATTWDREQITGR